MQFILLMFAFSVSAHLFAADITAYAGNRHVENTFTLSVCCPFRDEAEWMKEWIDFHLLVGVEHFYLYNNAGKDHYLRVLKPYIEKGVVELFDYPEENFQNADHIRLMSHAIEQGRGRTKWLAVIDSDEFLVPMKNDDLRIDLKELEKFAGLQVKWCLYGTSNVWSLKKGELLIEKLTFRSPLDDPHNNFHKTILQPELALRMRDCHSAVYLPGMQIKNIDRSLLRIHHYVARTEKFLKEVKEPRTKHWIQDNLFKRFSLTEYMKVANSIYDNQMARFVPKLKHIEEK